DNEGKVMDDVRAKRLKLAAAAAAKREQQTQTEKKDEPSMLTSSINKVKSMFTPGSTPPASVQVKQEDQANVAVGPAVTPRAQVPQPEASPQMQEARQLLALGQEALKHNDLAAAKR